MQENNSNILVLSNKEYQQPSQEEYFDIGVRAIDDRMEILRDEMRSEGIQDGSEMEAIISAEREKSINEFKTDLYGSCDNSTAFGEAACNATEYSNESGYDAFGHETAYFDSYENQQDYSAFGEAADCSAEINQEISLEKMR